MTKQNHYESIYLGLSIAASILSSFAIYSIFNSIFGYDMSYWKEMLKSRDFFSWALILTICGVPVVTGIIQHINGESLWRILIFPFLSGVVATVLVFLIGMIIYLFTSGEILKIILAIGIFMTLVAPTTKVLVIFFE